jgi:branched-chain amino acid transport system substrate-binding protein
VVGVLMPMSGDAALYGQSMKQAVELALEATDPAAGSAEAVQVVWADTTTDPSTAADKLRSMVIDDGARLVVSATTNEEARQLIPVLEETQAIGLSPSASAAQLTHDSEFFFRVLPSEDLEGRRAGRFLREERDSDRVIILTGESDLTGGIEAPFRQMFEESLGGTVVARIDLNDDSFRNSIPAELAASGPNGAYVIGSAAVTLAGIEALRAAGFDGTICATSALNLSEFVAQHADELDRVYFPQTNFDAADLTRPQVQEFVQIYRDRYGEDPDIFAAYAYDAMRLALHVADVSETYETYALKNTLRYGVVDYPGVTGVIRFNDYGDVHRNPIMFIVREGRVRNFESYLKEEKKRIHDRIRNLLTG